MSLTEILLIRNCIHITLILDFHLELMSLSACLKNLELKPLNLECIITYLALATIKNAKNETHRACGLRLILWIVVMLYIC